MLTADEYRVISADWHRVSLGYEKSSSEQSSLTLKPQITPPNSRSDAPFTVPSLPPQGVFGRQTYVDVITEKLLLNEMDSMVNPLVLRGMGGIGKTTLMKWLGHLLNQQFWDGVLWAELGPDANVRPILENWGSVLGLDLLPEREISVCRDRLQTLLYRQRVLLLIDDVWAADAARYFTLGGPSCLTILTTRELRVANELVVHDRIQKVDLL
ncbi:MAG: NB-ARC domain-containing protein, partial [Pseudomonadota bacterium]